MIPTRFTGPAGTGFTGRFKGRSIQYESGVVGALVALLNSMVGHDLYDIRRTWQV